MKKRNLLASMLVLLAALSLTACDRAVTDGTESTLQTTLSSNPETETTTSEYIDYPSENFPETTVDHLYGTGTATEPEDPAPSAETDDFDYATVSLPNYAAENPVRYTDEDEMFGGYNGWQYFGYAGEIKTIPQPMRSTYTYQMYSYFIRNDIAALYKSAGVPLPDAVLWLEPEWLTDTTSDGSRLLWYSMGTLPDEVTLEASGDLQNNAQTQPIFYAHYKVTEKGNTRDWLLYFIKTDSQNAAVFAVRVNENLDTVKALADSIVKSYEFLHNDFLYYQYAADLNYYSCMYLTRERTYLWNSSEKPNINAPTESAGFDTAYSCPTYATEYSQQILRTAVEYRFELIDAEEANYPFFIDQFPPSAPNPLHGIAMYREGKLTQWIANTDVGLSGNVEGFLQLRKQLLSLRNLIESDKDPSEITKEQKVTAVLYLRYNAYSPYNTAKYYENGTVTAWHFLSPVYEVIDFTAPLNSEEMTEKTEYTIGELPAFAGLDTIPMYFSTPPQYAMDDVGSFLAVFYLEDGSVRITSSQSSNEISPICNAAHETLNSLWDSRVAK